jgi:hypothetical protein
MNTDDVAASIASGGRHLIGGHRRYVRYRTILAAPGSSALGLLRRSSAQSRSQPCVAGRHIVRGLAAQRAPNAENLICINRYKFALSHNLSMGHFGKFGGGDATQPWRHALLSPPIIDRRGQ